MIHTKRLFHVDKGFTLMEICVVVAILGVLAVVAGISIGKYINQGKDEAYATELRDIQTAVVAMLHESSTGQLDSAQSDISDMDIITANSGNLVLSNYLKGLGEDGTILTGCTYGFSVNGTVTQVSTP